MKGIVFTSLADMVEEQCGIEVWDRVLHASKVKSGGVYTAGKSYPDRELFTLVEVLSKELKLGATELIRSFGAYLFNVLIDRHPHFYEAEDTYIGFLKSIKDVIHVEVKKLYEQATVPRFTYDQQDRDTITLYYQSPRKLCALAEGLIFEAAVKYGVTIDFKHAECMHRGQHRCKFIIAVERL